MEFALPRHAWFPLVALFGLLTAGFFFFLNTPPAYASGSTTSCGQAVCYVDSTVRGESDWASETYTAATGTPSTPGSGEQPLFTTRTVACSSWLSTSGNLVFRYPAQNSNTYTCLMDDQTIAAGCPPLLDRASNGRVDYYIQRVRVDGSTVWLYAQTKCLYPTDPYAPVERATGTGKVYTGGEANFYQTTSPDQVTQPTTTGNRTSGSGYIDRGVNLGNPEAYTGAWQPSFTAQTGTTPTGAPLYGFYRLLWELDYRVCIKYQYPSWLGVPARYNCDTTGTDVTVSPYTYSCDSNPPLRAGVHRDAVFDPARCVPVWECVITGTTTVGGQPAEVTLIRNGEPVPVVFATPSVNIYDPARVRNVGNWRQFNTINPGSTPEQVYVKQSWVWGSWVPYQPTGWIGFNWASTTEQQPFSFQSRYRFTADFLVPTQTTVGGGVSWVWVPSTQDCLTSGSPQVLVVRSVNR